VCPYDVWSTTLRVREAEFQLLKGKIVAGRQKRAPLVSGRPSAGISRLRWAKAGASLWEFGLALFGKGKQRIRGKSGRLAGRKSQ